MNEERGWVRYTGNTPRDRVVVHGEIYPCLITEQGKIQLPKKFGDYPFSPGLLFEIIDPFLVNIDKVLE